VDVALGIVDAILQELKIVEEVAEVVAMRNCRSSLHD
jgi:hypothetical protein